MPKVLLVDDEYYSRRLVHFVLDSSFQIFEARDGKEAIELAERELPDIILLDVRMPGMSGAEACAYLKQKSLARTAKVVMVTASDDATDRAQCLAAGADAYLIKPCRPFELAKVVTDLLAAAGVRLGPPGRAQERWIRHRWPHHP